MKIYLTRHGETQWNIEGRIQSHGDSPLTLNGIKSSKDVHDKLVNVNFDKIYSSNLGRAVHTAKIIRGNRNLDIIKLDGIREINLERWRGKYFHEFNDIENDLNHKLYNKPHEYNPSEDENFCDFYHRISKTIELILKDNHSENILIVSHFHTVRAILAYLNNIEIKNIPKEFPYIENNQVIIIEID